MLIKRGGGFKESEVTPHAVYLNRRAFMLGAAVLALAPPVGEAAPPTGQPLKAAPNPAYRLGDPPTPFKDVTTYNNFYEFGMNKDDPARRPTRSGRARGRSRWTGSAPGPGRTISTRSCAWRRSRSGSMACAVWRAGPW